MDSQNNQQQIMDNVKSILHVVAIGISIVSYFEPHLAILSVISCAINGVYHAITTNNTK